MKFYSAIACLLASVVLAAAVEIAPPAALRLEPDHKLKPVFERPSIVDSGRHEKHKIGDSANLYLDPEKDAHWIWHYGVHDSSVYWGPFTERDLEKFGLLDHIGKQLRENISATPAHGYHSRWRQIGKFVVRSKPFAERGLKMIPNFDLPKGKENPSFEKLHRYILVRQIRDRRVEFREMGLAKEARAALASLNPEEPPLPDPSEFKLVTDKQIPAALDESSWGPENDGLRAAALGPDEIRDGETLPVRLFIRNVTDHAIFMTVSDRDGYDVVTAQAEDGEKLQTGNARPYSMNLPVAQEIDPGSFTQKPPLATLTKLQLAPGAVWELKTKTALEFRLARAGSENFFEPILSVSSDGPVEADLTWHLHSANGIEHTEKYDRLWPAKGGWSGILRTAPVKVKLSR